MVSKDGFAFHRDEKGNKTGLFGKEWKRHCSTGDSFPGPWFFNGALTLFLFCSLLNSINFGIYKINTVLRIFSRGKQWSLDRDSESA